MFLDKKQFIGLKYKVSLHEINLTKFRSKINLKKTFILIDSLYDFFTYSIYNNNKYSYLY